MPRIYRNIYVAIWEDDKFPFCSDDCQAVWFHLMTCKYNTSIGFICESIAGLAAHRNKNGLWPFERYSKAFEEGLAKGFWEFDPKHQIIRFPKWFDWNKPNNPNVIKYWATLFNDIPNCDLKTQAIQEVTTLSEGLPKPFQESFTQSLTKPFTQALPKAARNIEHKHNKSFLSETSFSDESTKLCCLLISERLRNDIKAKVPEPPQNGGQPTPKFLKWVKETDDINRLDGREFKEIEKVILWSQRDEFWKCNILSPSALRRNFETLHLKMRSGAYLEKEDNSIEARFERGLEGK